MNAPGCMVDGDPNAPLLIIGMAPGREELKADKPFLGGSGQLLWKQLAKKAGINRADCYIINTIGEWPDGADGNPTKAQFDKYWEVFDQAVSASQARVAMLLGRAALWRFTGIAGGIEDWRGYLVGPEEAQMLTRTITREGVYKTARKAIGRKAGDPKIEKIKVVVPPIWPATIKWAIPSLHPAAVLRTGFASLPALASDTKRVGRALTGQLETSNAIWIDGLPNGLVKPEGGECVVDIETGGIDFGTLTRVGASVGCTVWTSLWGSDARECLRQCLGSGPSVAFNIGFDAPRLAAAGVPLPEPWADVMLQASLCEPDLKKSLNFVASLYLDKQRHKHLSETQPAFYNAMDVADTRALYHVLNRELDRTGQRGLFEKRMMPTVPALVDMTQLGIKVDEKVREEWEGKLTTQLGNVMQTWEHLAPGQKASGGKLLNYLYGELGLPVQYHKHGGITSEVSGIRKMLLYENLNTHQRDVLECLLQLRSIEKDLKTYAAVRMSEDGCIHPGFLPAGKDTDSFGKGIAGTGRITSSGPNIQNQTPEAKLMYIAHDPSLVLVERDYSQIEARIIAELSGDQVLKDAIAEGLHTANMRFMGVDKTRAKNGFYGWAYGMGARTMHNTFVGKGFNVSESECSAMLRAINRRYHVAAAWRERIAAEVSTSYHLANPFGRRRYFLGGGRDVPAGLDFLPQSCAADIMWTVLRPLADVLRGLGARVLATVHDSILIECPRGDAARASALMAEVMEQPWAELGGLVVPTEAKIGERWGDMKPMEAGG